MKEKRREKGYTQDILAEKIGCTRQLIGLIENNKCELSLNKLRKVSIVFNCSIDELIR